MWNFLIVAGFAVVFAIVDIPYLWNRNWIKELVAFLALLSLGVCLHIFLILGSPIINPLAIITKIYAPISKLTFEWLGLVNIHA